MSSSTKAWSSLDRKATAVAEFTLRQYRTRLSTWVVLVSCLVALSTVLLFYIDFGFFLSTFHALPQRGHLAIA